MSPLTISLLVFAVVVVADAVDDLAQTRWLLFEREAGSIQTPFLIVVVPWLGIIHGSFGLFSPRNWTVYAVMGLSAFSLSTAVFRILELDRPLSGMLHIPDAPLELLLQEIRR